MKRHVVREKDMTEVSFESFHLPLCRRKELSLAYATQILGGLPELGYPDELCLPRIRKAIMTCLFLSHKRENISDIIVQRDILACITIASLLPQ